MFSLSNPFWYKGSGVNRICCLLCLGLLLVFLCAAGISSAMDAGELAGTFLILSAILGGFSAVFGLLWFVWKRKENRAEDVLREVLAPDAVPRDATAQTVQTICLPREQLIGAARRRLTEIVRWMGIAALCTGALLVIIQVACGALKDFLQVLYIAAFSLLIVLPGLAVQGWLFVQYARSVPGKIELYPGRLVIDDTFFSAGEIREIQVSSERAWNRYSPAVFRKLCLMTEVRTVKYSIDYRSGRSGNDQPFWPEYPTLIDALSQWGVENSVNVHVLYMD